MDQKEIMDCIDSLPDAPATLNTPTAQREEALSLYSALIQTLGEDDSSVSFLSDRPLNQIVDEDRVPSSHNQAA
jgi:hypothetical protein